jgi:hypothetical protein
MEATKRELAIGSHTSAGKVAMIPSKADCR